MTPHKPGHTQGGTTRIQPTGFSLDTGKAHEIKQLSYLPQSLEALDPVFSVIVLGASQAVQVSPALLDWYLPTSHSVQSLLLSFLSYPASHFTENKTHIGLFTPRH